ncbi:hypothetical protein D6C95_09750, partial [Aureobasidium pullulans]
DARRKKICPGNWNRKHTCPETNQPDVWVYDSTREGNFDDDGSLPKKISNKLQFGSGIIQKTNNGKITKRINYLIADASSGPSDPVTPSGLMYTCDEFLFASTLQGGTGFAGDSNAGLTYSATTYCAPQGSRCGQDKRWQDNWLAAHAPLASEFKALKSGSVKKKWMKEHGLEYPESDQNLQAKALSQLANHFSKLQGDLFLYKLMTINKKGDGRFVYLDMNTGKDDDSDTDDEDEDEDDEDDNTKRDLTAQFMPPANVTTNQASGAGLVEASSLGLAVPSDAEHKSQVASVESNSDASTTSNNISGFISITRPAFSSQQAASGPLNIATATAGVLFSNNTRESIDSDHSSLANAARSGQSHTLLTEFNVSVASTVASVPTGDAFASYLGQSDSSRDVSRTGLYYEYFFTH